MPETGLTRLRRKRTRKIDWLEKEKQAWKPPERLTVSEWADKYRIMDSKTSAFPGRWRSDRTPYLREVMDQYNEPEVEEIVFCCASQVGKTETLLNIMGYIIDQDPNPALIVYPTLDLAEYASENRLGPMIQLSPTLAEKYDARASDRLELQFTGMHLVLSGANSPASLASRPVRYVLLDEVDKYPTMSAREADPVSLARERTKTFYNRKIILCSTPTIELGEIRQQFESCDVTKQYYVPCPH
jgi:phage terminase large subunit GpA-like protein